MDRRLTAGTALVPLRIFLGRTFVYAGIQKLTDPGFLHAAASTYGRQSGRGDPLRATYDPQTGAVTGGPAPQGLAKKTVLEHAGQIYAIPS